MTIHDFLNAHKKDLSNYKISKETGISESNVSRILNGETIPRATNFFKICKAIGIISIDVKEIQ